MSNLSPDEEKSLAWLKMKIAVRHYARDPSFDNAEKVESACGRLRQLESSSLLMHSPTVTGVRQGHRSKARPSDKG